LGEKRGEEHRGLGVEKCDQEPVTEDPLQADWLRRLGPCFRRGRAQRLYAEIDEVRRAGVFDDREGNRRHREERRKTERRTDRVTEIAKRDTHN
jgi:hypothetical protein